MCTYWNRSNRTLFGLLHGTSYFGNVLESSKGLLNRFFDIALRKSQEHTVIILRPASRVVFFTIASGLNETVEVGFGELSTCEAGVALLNQLRHIDVLNSERPQLRFKDGENLFLGSEEVVNADRLIFSRGGVAQNADHGLSNGSECGGVEEIGPSVEEGSLFVLQV